MSDLKNLIHNLIEKNGKFQIILIILLCLNSIQIGVNHTITSFHVYTPNFHCVDSSTENQCNNDNGTQCLNGYEFDPNDDRTVTVEWSLVCDRGYLGPLLSTLYFIGVTIGSLICSTLCDIYGRKKLVIICMYMQGLMSIGLYLSQNFVMFIVFRIIQGFFIQGLQTCSYTLMLEYCPSKYRTMSSVFWELNWAIGLGLLGSISYFIKDWRMLTLILLIPTALSLFYVWIIPESISWLYANNRHNEALKLIKNISKRNVDRKLMDDCDNVELIENNQNIHNFIVIKKQQQEQQQHVDEKLQNDDNDDVVVAANVINDNECHHKMLDNKSQSNEPNTVAKPKLLDLLRNRVLRKHLIIMISIWFSVTLSYYGLLYFLPSLAGQRHVNFLVGAGIEAIAYILAYFALSKFGRKIPMTFYQYANGILCITIGIMQLIQHTNVTEWILIVIALVAKGLAVSSFCGMFIYCSELFPTICRGVALGLCGFAARTGSLIAPQLILISDHVSPILPMVIIACLLIVTGTTTLLLPETLSSPLPNTVDEANQMWDHKKMKN